MAKEVSQEELTKLIGAGVATALKERDKTAEVEAAKAAEKKAAEEKAVTDRESNEKAIATKAVEEFLKSIPADKKIAIGMPHVFIPKKKELSFGSFLKAVSRNQQELIKKNWGVNFVDGEEKVIVEGTDASGGFVVPPEWAQELTRNVNDYAVLRPHLKKKTMKSDTRKDPIVTAGVTSYFVDENSEKTSSDWTLGQIEHSAKKICTLTPFSDETLEDSTPSAESIIMEEFRISINNKEDTDMFNGGLTGGATDPWTGVLNLTSVVSEPMAAGIDFDALFKVIGIILSNGAEDITIFYNPVIEGILRAAKGNNGQYLWANATAATPAVFGGYPMIRAKNIPKNLGDASNETAIVIGDFKNAEVADRKNITIVRGYAEDDFVKDRTSFRAVRRVSFKVHSSRENRFGKVTGIVVPS